MNAEKRKLNFSFLSNVAWSNQEHSTLLLQPPKHLAVSCWWVWRPRRWHAVTCLFWTAHSQQSRCSLLFLEQVVPCWTSDAQLALTLALPLPTPGLQTVRWLCAVQNEQVTACQQRCSDTHQHNIAKCWHQDCWLCAVQNEQVSACHRRRWHQHLPTWQRLRRTYCQSSI